MRRRLTAILQSDQLVIAGAMMMIGVGLKQLQGLLERRTTEMNALDGMIAMRRRELAELEIPLSPAPAGTYPGREDLDPLHNLEGDERG